ncbi:NhaR [Desulforapulum autotrophicum HRM2]|uniref:NhaR n=1 Tax=Desulforapulum autotrophicum (strain ATCC 43914 / DSM 3382 / VKM B-1955 / HRM2) TaxID=177437 RepID=C0QFC6_DESAH|nr:transcriptional activator NhaR [Desulforapulum autotrophicum]ACN13322.1 NhaR [Desulforapulum autotrophicum HRM2]
MEWLNYHHLFYFWIVMREGSITAACKKLTLAQSTVSAQMGKLEQSLGGKLFKRQGRSLEATDLGLMVFQYADRIFPLGRELMDQIHNRPVVGPLSLKVGIVDQIPKIVARKLLAPALGLEKKVHLICHEGKEEKLLGELAIHRLDLVLSDAPIRSDLSIKAYNHFLGQCGITFFAVDEIADTVTENFPHSLDKVPMLMPMAMTMLRSALDQWFESLSIQPLIVAEFEDNALLKVFGQAGDGVFVAPTVIESEIKTQYQVRIIGRCPFIKERFYAISVERILKHPAVVAISDIARHSIF